MTIKAHDATTAPQLSPAQRVKYQELLAWARNKERDYAALSPREHEAEEASWRKVLHGMNDDRVRAGARPLTVDPE